MDGRLNKTAIIQRVVVRNCLKYIDVVYGLFKYTTKVGFFLYEIK